MRVSEIPAKLRQMSLISNLTEDIPSHILILGLALLLDLVAGEPSERIHPTVLMGKVAERLSGKVGSKSHSRLLGCLLALAVLLATIGSTLLILEVTRTQLGQPVYVVLGALILKTSFAIKSMELHVRPIGEALEDGDIHRAREALSKIVRRKTEQLDEGLCASATIESIAEGTVDGIVSPLFYFFLFGVPGAMAFRAINTLDSTVGYKDSAYVQIGWFSAKLDTVANYLPARLTATMMILATAILGRDWRNPLSTLRREHDRTTSLNAGWPMSAMAGSIEVQLRKLGSYQLGDQLRMPTAKDIPPALKVMKFTTLLSLIAFIIPSLMIACLFAG